MSELTIDPQDTPDPNVMRFVTDRTLNPGAAKAYYRSDEAGADPVAADFFAIEGVAGLMIVNDFCMAHKADSAAWDDLVPKIKAVMHTHWP